MTPTEFNWRLRVARPGEHILYHTGNLMFDRGPVSSKVPHKVNDLAKVAWTAMEAGKACLVQKIVQDGTEYIAVKRRHPHKPVVWKGSYDPNRKSYVKPVAEAAE